MGQPRASSARSTRHCMKVYQPCSSTGQATQHMHECKEYMGEPQGPNRLLQARRYLQAWHIPAARVSTDAAIGL